MIKRPGIIFTLAFVLCFGSLASVTGQRSVGRVAVQVPNTQNPNVMPNGAAKAPIIVKSLTMSNRNVTSAQDEVSRVDKSKVPATGAQSSDFVPAGWKIESEAKGDVNGDGRSDAVLTVQEEKAMEGKQRGRALIVLTAQKNGSWKKAAVADRLLQCADCGGGMADLVVKIEKGVINIFQAQGNNASSLSNETYLFRYERATSRFRLIGADYVESGGPDKVFQESTNFLTGVRKTTRPKGRKDITTPSRVEKTKIYLEDVDNDEMGQEASARIGS
ncbi:MAG TPA: hypothetical protein VM095_15095 [Pyrinomonadaceae bacterium]|nr:hypothetical protein [Pyrinomonadaceae bacterium]